MATQKKPSGLGRGLDDLLDDNTPTTRTNVSANRSFVVSKGSATREIDPSIAALYGNQTKTLYDNKPKTRSVKSNFKK